MGKGHSTFVDRVRGKDGLGTPYDLASEETLEAVRALLDSVIDGGSVTIDLDVSALAKEAKQDAEISLLGEIRDNTASISIDADSVNLNTDELEAKVDAVKASVDTLDSHFVAEDFATQATLSALDAKVTLDADAGIKVHVQNPTSSTVTGTVTADQGTPNAGGAQAWPVNTGLAQPLTDAQLRASAVAVSGPLTDAQLRALAVAVSGPLTDAQLRASPVPVSGEVGIASRVDPLEVSGSGSALNATPIPSTDVREYSSVAVQVSGTFSATWVMEESNDGTNWVSIAFIDPSTTSPVPQASTTSTSGIRVATLQAKFFRVRISSYTSGTMNAIALFQTLPLPLLGSYGRADRTSFTDGSSLGFAVGGVFNESLAADVAEDQFAAMRITAKRAVHANLRDNSGTEVGTAGNPIRTLPTGTAGTQDVNVVSSVSVPVTGPLTDTQLRASPVPVTASGTIGVTQSTSPWVTNDPGLPDALGQQASAGSTGVALSTEQEAKIDLLLKKSDFEARINTEGQKAMAASTPVVIASDQSAIPISGSVSVSGTPSVDVTDRAGRLLGKANMQVGGTDVSNANPVPISDGGSSVTIDGAVSVSNFPAVQPVNDNGSSLTVDTPQLPATIGQKASAASTSVVLSTEQEAMLSAAGSNASIGSVGASTPSSATMVGGKDPNGILKAIPIDVGGPDGVQASPTFSNHDIFADLTVGGATTGWTKGGDTATAWAVINTSGSGGLGGKSIQPTPNGTGISTLLRDSVGTVYDFDAVLRFNRNSLATGRPGIFRGTAGTGSAVNGYFLRSVSGSPGSLTLERYDNSTTPSSTIGSSTPTYATTDWMYMRFKAVGGLLRCKIWASGSAEPTAWDIEATDTTYSSGQLGIAQQNGPAATAATIFDVFVNQDVLGVKVSVANVRTGALQNGAEVAVSSTAVKIYSGNPNAKEVIVQNTGLARVRIGTAGVTATTGFRLESGGHKTFSDPVVINDIYAIRETSVDSIVFATRVI